MCRFVYYQGEPISLASLITEPEHSLIHQSFHSHEREEPLNGDGFGVAWFAEEEEDGAALFRSVSPAWSNMNLREIARVTRSGRILAHVRAATQGIAVNEPNCHPFRMDGLVFMHNGDLGGFHSYRRALLDGLSDVAFHAIRGSTDSEHFMALVADALHEERGASSGPRRLADAIARALARVLELREAAGVEDHVYLNCAVTDGRAAAVCRFTTDAPENADTLYVHLGRKYTCADGQARLEPCPEGRTSVLVSSEPLTRDPGWDPIPVGTMLLVREDRTVEGRSVHP